MHASTARCTVKTGAKSGAVRNDVLHMSFSSYYRLSPVRASCGALQAWSSRIRGTVGLAEAAGAF
jgi:hypothetical protein